MPGVTYEGMHHLSIYNKSGVEQGGQCSCFYCMETFPSTDVVTYVDMGKTALCPRCGIDSVLPEAWVHKSPELLKEMHKRFF